MYAMVNVRQYQIVATGQTVAECQKNYEQQLITYNVVEEEIVVVDTGTATGEIAEIRSAVINGNTVYFLRLDEEVTYYRIAAKDAEEAVLLDVGDTVTVTFEVSSGAIVDAVSVERS